MSDVPAPTAASSDALPPPPRPALCLRPLLGPPLQPITIRADGPRMIGRDPECEVRLDDRRVSRRQARIERRAGRWTITDLDSRYGTHLHTIRLDPGEETPLGHKDLLHLGPWTFQVLIDAAPAAEPSAHHQVHTNPSLLDRLRRDRPSVRDASWKEFAERYTPVIAGFARNQGLRGQEIDDVVQDVLLSVSRAITGFDYDPSKGRFRGWLKKATISAVLRSRERLARFAPAGLIEPGAVADTEQPPSDVDCAWELEWTRDLLRRALEQVREQVEPPTWEAFERYGRQGVPGEEVARELGMRFDAVRKAKSNVMRRLREAVTRLGAEA